MIDHRLSPLKKSDLKFKYAPSTSGGDDPAKRNLPDSNFLNREEWYEVLYFVNKFANDKGGGKVGVAMKAERLIKTQLPAHLHSHAHVSDWLVSNWEKY
jgi:hypothetical protein